MLEFTQADLSDADLDRLRRIYQPLTRSVRELIDATIRTQVDATTVADVTAQIDAATARLRSTQLPDHSACATPTRGTACPGAIR